MYTYIYINRHTQIIQPIVSTSSKALAAATSAWHRWPSGEMWPKTAILHENSILSTKNQWHVNLMIIYIYIIIYIIKSTTYFIYIYVMHIIDLIKMDEHQGLTPQKKACLAIHMLIQSTKSGSWSPKGQKISREPWHSQSKTWWFLPVRLWNSLTK
jgi:hypothetical protein